MLASTGRIVTFYSYKGGTGRSMALANVAWVLASSGARVLVVDWDLEAPGLHRYFRPFLADKELVRDESDGLIDLMVGFAERMATPASGGESGGERWYEQYADIGRWSKQLLWPSGEDAVTRLGGTIHFVPAGRQGPGYAKRVNSFDWAGFYRKYSGGAFVDAVRRSMLRYDWVLIDSRTGVSDTSGICTMQLPDTLVVCFTLNYQSIDGAAAVAASAKAGRKSGLRIVPLPTRLDASEDQLLRSMMTYARTLFDPLLDPDVDRASYWRTTGIPYFPRYAYAEKLAPFEEQVSDATSALPAVERLTAHITRGSIGRLEPLPESHRRDALAEFEQVPGAEIAADPEPAAGLAAPSPASERVPLPLRRGAYWVRRNAIAAAAAGLLFAVIAYQTLSQPAAPAADAIVRPLIDEANGAIEEGRADHAALLVAETAGRLDPASVVGPGSGPGSQIYDALLRLGPLRVSDEPSVSVQFSPDGQWLAVTSASREIRLFPFPPQAPSEGSPVGYSAAAFSPDSRYLAASSRSGLVVIETTTMRRIWEWANPDPDSAWMTAVSFSPDGDLLAAGTDTGTVVLAQVEPWSGRDQFSIRGGVDFLAFSPDSQWIAAGGRSSPEVASWPAGRREPLHLLEGHDGGVAAMTFVPAGRPQASALRRGLVTTRLVTASTAGTGRVWTLTDGGPTEERMTGQVSIVSMSPAGDLLATNDNGSLVFWRTQPTVQRIRDVTAGPFEALAFSDDGQVVFTGDARGRVTRWNATDGTRLQEVSVGPGIATLAARPRGLTGPGGHFVAVASSSGTYLLLPQGQSSAPGTAVPTMSAAQARALACSHTRETQLTAEEWRRHFGDEPLRYTCGGPAAVPQKSLPR